MIGYVGRIDEADLAKLGETSTALHAHRQERASSAITRTRCAARIGYEQVETNVEGRALRTVGRVPAVPGADLRLSIDLDLQQAAVDRLRRFRRLGGRGGSAHRRNPRDGQPAELRSEPVRQRHLARRLPHADGQPVAAAVQPQRARRRPAGFDDQAVPRARRTGQRVAHAARTRCSRPANSTSRDNAAAIATRTAAPGWTDLRKSIAAVGELLLLQARLRDGHRPLRPVGAQVRFRRADGHRPAGRNIGIVPSPEWKAKHSKEPWYVGETVISGIGQGYWKVTLLQLARGVAALADDGQRRAPASRAPRRDGYNAAWVPLPQPRADTHHRQPRAPARGAGRNDGHDAARRHRRGVVRGAPYLIAGKTGTAQNTSRKGSVSSIRTSCHSSLRHQAWFIALRAGGRPDDRGGGDGRARRLRRQHRRPDRAQDHGCLAAGQDAGAGSESRRDRHGRHPGVAGERAGARRPQCRADTASRR